MFQIRLESGSNEDLIKVPSKIQIRYLNQERFQPKPTLKVLWKDFLANKNASKLDNGCTFKCMDGEIRCSIFGMYYSDYFRKG